MTLLKIASRNIWRNKKRTWIIIITIAIGLWGMITSNAFYDGMLKGMIDNAIKTDTGHFQIHKSGFHTKKLINLTIDNKDKLLNKLKKIKGIKALSTRIKFHGMISTAEFSSGVMVEGIESAKEPLVSHIKSKIESGKYLKENDSNSIIIGKSLAEKIKAGLDDKIVIMAQGLDNQIASSAFRIKGIFNTGEADFDKTTVFITIKKAANMLVMKEKISEVVGLVNDPEKLTEISKQIKVAVRSYNMEVLTWKEIIPILVQFKEMMSFWIGISYLIVFTIVGIEIINIFFMVIFERFREFGIMKAIGTKPSKIFFGIVLESFIICIIGMFIGSILSITSVTLLMKKGVDLSFAAKGIEIAKMNTIIYPTFTFSNIMWAVLSVLLTAVIVPIYPALKAAKIKPVKALRKI